MSVGFTLMDGLAWARNRALETNEPFVVLKNCGQRCSVRVIPRRNEWSDDWKVMYYVKEDGSFRSSEDA